MFKSVSRSLKIANKLKDDRPKKLEAERDKKASKKWLQRLASAAGEDLEDENGVGQRREPVHGLAHERDEGFLVRQSKKKFNKFVARLRNVRRMSSMQVKPNSDFEGKSSKCNSNTRDKVVKFKLSDEERASVNGDLIDSFYNEDDDSDDDDAYVSASDTFDDEYEFDEPMGGARGEPQREDAKTSRGQSSELSLAEFDSGDKLILPEELCDIPTFKNTQNSPRSIIDETRRLLIERYQNNPDSFYDCDYQRMLNDDWTVTRFLLRRRQDPKRTAKLMEECGKFRKEFKMGEVTLSEFPIEFHLPGGLFKYAPDLVGNVTMYMRIKMYRRVPEISDIFKAFILCVLEQCDVECDGRGTAVVFDLSGCGLQNVDLGFLYWLLNSFRNYCPKGVSYILVYNLPWFLSATAKLAMTWMSETNRRSLRFVQGKEIENFIARENLPDYLGGTCPLDYKTVPKSSRLAVEVCEEFDITVEQANKIKELFKEFLPADYDKAPARLESLDDGINNNNSDSNSNSNEQPNTTTSDQQSDSELSASTLAAAPVVQLVSNASKFIVTN